MNYNCSYDKFPRPGCKPSTVVSQTYRVLSSLPAPWVSSGIFKFPLIFFSISNALADSAIAPLPQRKNLSIGNQEEQKTKTAQIGFGSIFLNLCTLNHRLAAAKTVWSGSQNQLEDLFYKTLSLALNVPRRQLPQLIKYFSSGTFWHIPIWRIW